MAINALNRASTGAGESWTSLVASPAGNNFRRAIASGNSSVFQ